jgi:hypothetical protein
VTSENKSYSQQETNAMSATATKPNPGAPVATEMRQRAQEFARSLGMSHYREAIENGETLSTGSTRSSVC